MKAVSLFMYYVQSVFVLHAVSVPSGYHSGEYHCPRTSAVRLLLQCVTLHLCGVCCGARVDSVCSSSHLYVMHLAL